MGRPFAATLLACCVTFVGCGGQQQAPEGTTRFKALAVLYGTYQGAHGGRTPENEEEFRSYVEARGGGYLERFGVEDADELLVSPRDELPLVLYFGENSFDENSGGTDRVIAAEQVGVDGRRVVITSLGSVMELGEQELGKRLPREPRTAGR